MLVLDASDLPLSAAAPCISLQHTLKPGCWKPRLQKVCVDFCHTSLSAATKGKFLLAAFSFFLYKEKNFFTEPEAGSLSAVRSESRNVSDRF